MSCDIAAQLYRLSVHLSVILEKSQGEEIAKDFRAKHKYHYQEWSVDMENKEWQRGDTQRFLLTFLLLKHPKVQVSMPFTV